uniref:Uncharacterized protein n=1 Tax=Oryza rufipogon TaxID=4529 RepID=A0A0E0PGE8_ORYRU
MYSAASANEYLMRYGVGREGMLTGERRCGGRIEGGRRAPPLLAGWGSAQAAGEETKFEAEAEAGWDGLGCSPASECGGSRRTPAPPLLDGDRQARRRDGTDCGGGGRAALCCRGSLLIVVVVHVAAESV